MAEGHEQGGWVEIQDWSVEGGEGVNWKTGSTWLRSRGERSVGIARLGHLCG